VNVILVSIGIGFKTGMRPTEAMKALGLAQHWISLLVLALLGLVLAELLSQGSWLGAVLLVLPFTMARRTFRVYVELTEAYTSTVRSLVTAIEAKDPYTRGHSERVADYACRLAERIGMPRAEIDLIERAALLHDVGKIGISLDTLVSPQKLTPDQVNAIRQHPALGSDLVSDVEFLSDIVDIIRHHHERCDGTGYPDGLVGERISVPARILAVADAYDAMTSDRAYRPRMTDGQARQELHRVTDSQLDGEIVRQFTDMLAEDLSRGASA
jgi:putative nucleotidyltransferase with HDIG domain